MGTAGRRPTSDLCTKELFDKAYNACANKISILVPLPEDRILVSGGAAVIDHIAVKMFLYGFAPKLILHLPAKFENGAFTGSRDAETSNYYHRLMKSRSGIDGLADIDRAIRLGAVISVSDGFFARNNMVANSKHIIAETFSTTDDTPADGGTLHTWNKSKSTSKHHINLYNV